jgi:5-hydroxyisourate hydrolase
LTTHVLDTAHGRPAAGLALELWSLDGTPEMIKAAVTNGDGRVDAPLLEGEDFKLEGEDFKAGVYELRFHAGAYLEAAGVTVPEPAFLDVVPIRFGISDETAHYHVPLLLSPYGYATYRGS